NRRAPAGALEETPTAGSAAVLGRINPTTDPMPRLDQANAAPEHSPAGMHKQRACPHIGVGKREAFGVRRLAAALFLRPNNVSVPISPRSDSGSTPTITPEQEMPCQGQSPIP
ncbi:MAG: hypothetical protein GX456_02785, partial [Verrucomicrobia bacterium]|nr:hypothetical protein [Verrucomicrobiota bacterium]